MKIYVKLLFARIELLAKQLQSYKKWENDLNAGGLAKLRDLNEKGDTSVSAGNSKKNGQNSFLKAERGNSNTRSVSKSSKSSKLVSTGITTAKPAVVSEISSIHPSIDPLELEKRLVDLYYNLPSPSPEIITNLLLILNAPLSKINPEDLLYSVKHERSRELLQEPVKNLLDQIAKREVYLEARIAHLEKELKDTRERGDAGKFEKKPKTPVSTSIPYVTLEASVKKSLAILERNYDALQNLEWKEDSVSSFLENLELDLQNATHGLKLVIS